MARDDWSFTVAYEHPFAHREDPGWPPACARSSRPRRLTYRLCAPFHLRLRIDFVDAGGSNVIGFFIQPETERDVPALHDALAGRPRRRRRRMAEAVEFELAVLREDLRVQEAYHELVLPLDATAEVHTRADRTTLELRRVPGRPGPAVDRGVNVTVVDHPVLAHRVAQLRDRATGGDTFRQLISEVSGLLAYEALRDLGSAEVAVDTPVTDGAPARRGAEVVLLVPILRAGLGMVQSIQEIVPLTEVAHVGLRRDDVTLRSDVYLNRLPRDLGGRRVVVCDPMLATGGSLGAGLRHRGRTGSDGSMALCIIASEPGLAVLAARHPDVPVFCAAIDPQLNELGYIVPGLGDAGDRLFGPPD